MNESRPVSCLCGVINPITEQVYSFCPFHFKQQSKPAAQPLQVSAEQLPKELLDAIVAVLVQYSHNSCGDYAPYPNPGHCNLCRLAAATKGYRAALAATPSHSGITPEAAEVLRRSDQDNDEPSDPMTPEAVKVLNSIVEARVPEENFIRDGADAAPPLVEPQRWIPVNEKLPEQDQRVLAFYQAGHITVREWSDYHPTWAHCGANITHWQYLPAPPGAEASLAVVEPQPRPKIICLCGSTKFIEQFAIKTWELELEGNIVLGCTLLPSWYCPVRDHFAEELGVKEQRDNHHLQKIDLADEILVLNVGGYIGKSTRQEIAYAEANHKPVRYLEAEAYTSSSRVDKPQEE